MCLSNPCLNGGTCIDEEKSYSCECDTNMYVGNQCEYLLGSCDFEDPDLRLCNFKNQDGAGMREFCNHFEKFSFFNLFFFRNEYCYGNKQKMNIAIEINKKTKKL